jgi:formate/nitrite transporter FocA (FNT family)
MADRRPGRNASEDERSDLASAFARTVAEGEERLARTWPGLIATGITAGFDVDFGVLALLIVKHATGSELLGALAFTMGFVALTLGNVELFTENFLVPIGTLVAGRSSAWELARLWATTLGFNLVGGWSLTALMMSGYPNLHRTAVEVGRHYPGIGTGWRRHPRRRRGHRRLRRGPAALLPRDLRSCER